jgi:AcrR family transcriptional regulator
VTRQRLIDAATQCFAEYGYTGTRISDIVFRAGVSQGNFYRHFDSKVEILAAVIKPCVEDLLRATGGRGRTAGIDRKALIDSTTAYFSTYARNRHTLRVTREASAIRDDGGFAEVWVQIRALFTERTARWLSHLQDSGHIDAEADVKLLAEALGAMTDQLAYVKIGLPAELPRPEEIQEMGRVVGEVWYRSLAGPTMPETV